MYWHHIERPVASSELEKLFLAKVKLRQVLENGQGLSCRTQTLRDHIMLISPQGNEYQYVKLGESHVK